MSYRSVNLKIPAELRKRVKVAAALEGVTMQTFIRDAIEVAVQSHEAQTGASR